MVVAGRFVRVVGGAGGEASRRDASHVAGERSYRIGAALREPASVPVFARRVPPVRQPAPGTLLVAGLRDLWPACALRLPAQAARIAGAVLPVAPGDIGMVAQCDSGGWADWPDAKRLGVRGAMHLRRNTGPPIRGVHDVRMFIAPRLRYRLDANGNR